MTERVEITICKGSTPSDAERFTIKRLPVPGGTRQGVNEHVFATASLVQHATKNLAPGAELCISPAAKAELQHLL